MSSLDDLPQRAAAHTLGDDAELALRNAVARAGCFIVQSIDRHDYGSDVQLEALDGTSASNCRVHIQLKGTATSENRDGTVSVGDIDRTNLNYLLSTPHACYVGFHAPSQRLMVRVAEEVFTHYEHKHPDWQKQETLTVRFGAALFDDDFQRRLRDKLLASHRVDRDQRLDWAVAKPEQVKSLFLCECLTREHGFVVHAAAAA